MMIRAIGPYQLVRPLGRGGMAEVHLAVAHGASGFERRVAIKTLAPELAGDPDLERALIREAVLGGALHHRNVVAVLGLGCDDGAYYVVLEHVDGGDLARWLDPARPVPEPLALHVAHELALALAYLHGVRDSRVTGRQVCADVRTMPILADKKIFSASYRKTAELSSALQKQRKNNPLI